MMTRVFRAAICSLSMMLAAGVPAAWAVTAGDTAPAFTATASDGSIVSLSDFAGKTVVLEWTNYHCPFVRKFYDAGKMQELQKSYTDKGVVWLSVISSAPGKQGHLNVANAAEAITVEGGHASHVLLDEAGTVGRAYDAKTTPHMYVITPEGMVAYAGAIDSIPSTKGEDIAKAEHYVVNALDHVLQGEDVTVGATTAYGCSVKYGDS